MSAIDTNIYAEKMKQTMEIYPNDDNYAVYGYIVKGIKLHGIAIYADNPITVELKCAVYSTCMHKLRFAYGIWVCGKPVINDEIKLGPMKTSPCMPSDEWAARANEECEEVAHRITDNLWDPKIVYDADDQFFIVTTDIDACDTVNIPTVVINACNKKGTIITDLQEYYLKKMHPDAFNVYYSIINDIVVYNPGVVPRLYEQEICLDRPFIRLVEKYQMMSNGGIELVTMLGNIPVCIDIEASEDCEGILYAGVEVKDSRTLATMYELNDIAHVINMNNKIYLVQCKKYEPDNIAELKNIRNETYIVSVKEKSN